VEQVLRGKTLTSGRHKKMWNRWDAREKHLTSGSRGKMWNRCCAGKTLTSDRRGKMWNRWDARESIKPVVGAGKYGAGGMRGKNI